MKRDTNRGGFTLIELLVVTVVVVTLMGVVFRLAGVGGTNRAKAETIQRLQRLENALSGYYAAYGSYPPVPLQGRSRSIYKSVDAYGRQEKGEQESGGTSMKSARTLVQIEAACRAQPLSVSWPAPSDGEINNMIQDLASVPDAEAPYKGFRTLSSVGSLNLDAIDWRAQSRTGKDIQLFEFGLLSFLFPRYFFMLEGKMSNFYDHKVNGRYHNQWAANNQLPCRLDTGAQFADWDEVRKMMGAHSSSANARWEAGMISNLTSQAVCARWMPNFQGIVTTIDQPRYRFFYGVDVLDQNKPYLATPGTFDVDGVSGGGGEGDRLWGRRLRVFPGGGSGSGGSTHLLLSMTVCDGWGHEFYYYSEPPYQSYRLWSAGSNKVTFPPWYDLDSFSGEDLNMIHSFISDDIVHLSN